MNQSLPARPLFKTFSIIAACISLSACGDNAWWSNGKEPEMQAEQIKKVIPARVNDRQSWAQDIFDIMQELSIPKTKQNVCSVVAVVDQESNFVADPAVPGLGEKAVQEINSRLKEKFEAKLGETIGGTVAEYFEDVLKNQPSPENNYMSQMRKVKSGNIAELRNDLYTQYGGLYYGIHRLMEYPADYDKAIYRFADYNSGMYSSRNAAFQSMLNAMTKTEISLDGDLLLYTKNGDIRATPSQTEKELIAIFAQNNILVTPRQIRTDLKKEKEKSFEDTQTYLAVQKLYQNKTKKEPIYATMPQVVISGPKLSRDYNTNWFASRVNGRYETCMQRAKRIKL